MDGSHHKWNGKDEWCLIAAVDDATSDIPYAEFFLSEDTLNCMTVIQKIIEKKGYRWPLCRSCWMVWRSKEARILRVQKACEDLGIRVIFANSPQGKGRIERTWDTFQDRIIPEMRIRGITSIPAANSFLWEEFIPCYWRTRNVIAATNFEVRYKRLPEGTDLNEIFALKTTGRSKETTLLAGTVTFTESKMTSHSALPSRVSRYEPTKIYRHERSLRAKKFT